MKSLMILVLVYIVGGISGVIFRAATSGAADRGQIAVLEIGHPLSGAFARELERIKVNAIYQKRVFYIQNLGFITPTEARRISFEEALRFERFHKEAYRNFGFEIVPVEPGSLSECVAAVKAAI